MAFSLPFVVLICHAFLKGSNCLDLNTESQTEGQRFERFQQLYGRKYEKNEDLNQSRINFHNSLERHSFLNSALKKSNHSARYGINQFSDLSPKQFRERYLTVQAEAAPMFDPSGSGVHFKMRYPPRFDWRDRGVVGPVQNQQSCGGCWAFSVVGAVESVSAKDGGKLQQLSVQQVIDCSYKNQGCNGGSPVEALHWLSETKLKLVNQAAYPFKAVSGICQYFPLSHDGVAVKNYSAYGFSGNEEVMMKILVESGPLVVIVDALSWQDYLGGIIQHHCSSQNPNHAVIITGYDTTGEVPFWIVRNSWGTSWGDDGYVYIKIGDNMCGVADSVAAVLV